jgi:amino acid transporter
MLGFLMGNLFSSSRLLFALGRDGFLPRAFGVVDARHRVPMLALAAHAIIAVVLAVAGSFETLALISGGAICLVFAAVAAAAWRTQRMDLRGHGDPMVLPGGALVPAVAVITMAAILATMSTREWLAIALSLTALVVVYAVLAALRGRAARTSRI